MVGNGYDLRQESDGTWSVIDVFKNEPVTLEGHEQVKLSEAQARDSLEYLCRKYIERHSDHSFRP